MPPKKYAQQLTRAEIRTLFVIGRYRLDEEAGHVVSGTTGKPVHAETNGSKYSTPFVRLYYRDKCRCVAFSHVVWMVRSGCDIPDGWEIHHVNGDPLDNRFENLVCVTPEDHRKLHGAAVEEIPF